MNTPVLADLERHTLCLCADPGCCLEEFPAEIPGSNDGDR